MVANSPYKNSNMLKRQAGENPHLLFVSIVRAQCFLFHMITIFILFYLPPALTLANKLLAGIL